MTPTGCATASTSRQPARLLAATGPDLAAHLRRHGPRPPADGLIGVVEAAGLAGRGGAGFPTWRKLAAVAGGARPVVVANGAEGEPASTKDAALLTAAPHLVLDGLALAVDVVGAHRAVAYLPAPLVPGVRAAVDQRRAARVDRHVVEFVEAPAWFVAGEESAVVAAVEGHPALPRDTPRRVVEVGVGTRPTLVHNVETLAQLALLARRGVAWFRSVGTADEPGSLLSTVSGSVTAPGVYELAFGTPLPEVLAAAGGVSAGLRAVLVGGFHGGWVPAEGLGVATLSRAGLAPFGVSPGSGVVRALPATVCGLVESARVAGYLAGQSAGQCGPCRFGLPAVAGTLDRLARGAPDPRLVGEVERLAGLVAGRGACHHPDGTARFVRSSLRVFATEVGLHLRGRCSVRR